MDRKDLLGTWLEWEDESVGNQKHVHSFEFDVVTDSHDALYLFLWESSFCPKQCC